MPIDTLNQPQKSLRGASRISIDSDSYEAIAIAIAASAAVQINAHRIMLSSDQPCHIAIGDDSVVATTGHTRFPAITQFPLVIEWTPGDYISVIRETADGTLHVNGVY